MSKSPNANPVYHKETHQHSFKSTGSCSSPIAYADVVKKVNVEEPKIFPAASSNSLNNMKNLNSAVHATSNSMTENHISAPTLSSSNISINETKFNVFPVPGDGNCFLRSLSLILNGDFSMSNNNRQLICTFILQNWASWEDRILISHDHSMTKYVYANVMLNGNGSATSLEIAAASLLLDLQIDIWLHQRNVYSKNTFIPCNLNFYTFHLLLSGSHFQPMRKNHHVNNSSVLLKSQPTNSSGSKKRKGSKISLPNTNRKLGLNYKVPSDIESAEERKKENTT